MEMVLDVYKRPFNPCYPVVCMDESPKQLIAEKRVPVPASPGQPAKHDYEYKRCGVCNIFMACELEFVYTPKHGSWLNMAEIELNVLTGQCLNRRIDDIELVRKETRAWQEFRNNKNAKVNWQFKTEDARIKLSRLYPTIDG
jgi:hypothetical protein